jgi:hypothetical protein
MTPVPVRTASRMWFRMSAAARSAHASFYRWRWALSPILPF